MLLTIGKRSVMKPICRISRRMCRKRLQVPSHYQLNMDSRLMILMVFRRSRQWNKTVRIQATAPMQSRMVRLRVDSLQVRVQTMNRSLMYQPTNLWLCQRSRLESFQRKLQVAKRRIILREQMVQVRRQLQVARNICQAIKLLQQIIMLVRWQRQLHHRGQQSLPLLHRKMILQQKLTRKLKHKQYHLVRHRMQRMERFLRTPQIRLDNQQKWKTLPSADKNLPQAQNQKMQQIPTQKAIHLQESRHLVLQLTHSRVKLQLMKQL